LKKTNIFTKKTDFCQITILIISHLGLILHIWKSKKVNLILLIGIDKDFVMISITGYQFIIDNYSNIY
jgi:hypothetical protein